MAKSSVHALLGSLVERGYAYKQADRSYTVGVKAWEVGCRATFTEIGRVAAPYMAELARSVGEGASLALLDEVHTVCIQIVESPQVVRVHSHIGERSPAHCLSTGVALLAALTDEEVVARLPKRLQKMTPKTIASRDELLVELESVRQCGYSICRGTWRLDVAGLAVAIKGVDGRAVAALAIALPLERLTPSHEKRITAGLLAQAAAIERELGAPMPAARSSGQTPRAVQPARATRATPVKRRKTPHAV